MKSPLNRWVLIFLLLVMAIAWNFLVGCAELPKCEKWQYQLHQQEGRIYYILDENNAVVLVQMIEGLAKGTCRVEI